MSNKNFSVLICAAVLLVMILLLCIIIKSPAPSRNNETEIAKSVEKSAEKTTPPAPEFQVPTPLPAGGEVTTVSKSPLPAQIPEESTVENNTVILKIQDALGEPIPSGSIQIGSQKLPFSRGEARIPFQGGTPAQFIAEATGYQSATATITAAGNNQDPVILEYLSDYEIQVQTYSAFPKPVTDAQVTLYKFAASLRPVMKNFTTEVKSHFNQYYPVVFFYDSYNLIVNKVMCNSNVTSVFQGNATMTTTVSNKAPVNNYANRETGIGDSVEAIGQYGWNGTIYDPGLAEDNYIPANSNNSRHLRIVDSLRLADKGSTTEGTTQTICFSSRGENVTGSIAYPPMNTPLEVVTTFTSDENGICIAKNLLPGLYYVQAAKGQSRSEALPLFPTVGKVQLGISSHCKLRVITQFANVPDSYKLRTNSLKNVIITVKPAETGMTSLKIADTGRRGNTVFDSLPFGDYVITAAPPIDTKYPQITERITLNKPEQTVRLFFEGWERNVIYGDVIRADTKEKIPGCKVELLEETPGGTFPAAGQTSDVEGKFRFESIPSGRYQIAHCPVLTEKNQFYPFSEEMMQQRKPEEKPFIGREADEWEDDYASKLIVLSNQKEQYVELQLAPAVRTRFEGQVCYRDGKPAPGAHLEVRPFKTSRFVSRAMEPAPVSDDQGNFKFDLITKGIPSANSFLYNGKIKAAVMQIENKERQMEIGGVQALRYTEKHRQPVATGDADVNFHLGDSMNEIRITVDNEHLLTVDVIIETENGILPTEARCYAAQDLNQIWGEKIAEGRFQIRGVESSGFSVLMQDAYRFNDETSKLKIYYADNSQILYNDKVQEILRASRDKKNIQVKLQLKEAGYFEGKVLDAYGNPFGGVCVATDSYIGTAMWSFSDSKGNFLINKLSKEKSYPMYVSWPESATPTLYIQNLKPTVTNIVLKKNE